MGAVLCEIYVKGVDDLSLFLLPPVLWTVVLPCSADFPNYLIVSNPSGQPTKIPLYYQRHAQQRPLTQLPFHQLPPSLMGFASLLSSDCLILVAIVVVYINCFSGLAVVCICECHIVSLHKDWAKRKGILYFFPRCMLNPADLGEPPVYAQ